LPGVPPIHPVLWPLFLILWASEANLSDEINDGATRPMSIRRIPALEIIKKREQQMAHWIFIEEGAYRVEAAFFLTPGYTAVTLEDALMEVYLDAKGERRVRGQGIAMNLLIVELLEEHDDIDLLLDLNGEFRYLLKTPSIMAGKIFSPDVKSTVHFVAKEPLQKLTNDEYLDIQSRMVMVDLQAG